MCSQDNLIPIVTFFYYYYWPISNTRVSGAATVVLAGGGAQGACRGYLREVEATGSQAELGSGWYAECAGEPPSRPIKNKNKLIHFRNTYS